MYLIDTNVLSQLAKSRPNKGVLHFFKDIKVKGNESYLSVITLGEIRKGIDKLVAHGDTLQSHKLNHWLESLKLDYKDNILPVDTCVGEWWGKILATADDTNAIDKLLAATAITHNLILVTRNVGHLRDSGAKLLNPFD